MTLTAEIRRKLLRGAVIGLATALAVLAFWGAGLLETPEAKTWDWRAKHLAAPGTATGDIVLVLLDQNSLDWALEENGLTWPWPREIYAAIVDYCRRSGARGIAFDVLFTEPSKYGVADDQAFGAAVDAFGRATVALFLGRDSGKFTAWPPDAPPSGSQPGGRDAWHARHPESGTVFPRATLPIPELGRRAALLSNVHLDPDPDGTYRRVQVFGEFDGRFVPALGLGAYLAAAPASALHLAPGGLTVDGRPIPIDDRGRAVLRYRGPSGTHRTFSAAAVLQSEIRLRAGEAPTITDATAFKDKFVFFGFSAPGLFDLRTAPVGGVYPGVEIQATLLDNLLSADFIRPVAPWVTAAATLIVALGCALAVSLLSRPLGAVGISLVWLALPLAAALAAYPRGYWLTVAPQETAAAAAAVFGMVANYATEGRQKRFIKNAFRQYLSPAVIDQLIAHPERLKLGGERRPLSIFFSDLQGFTSISEGLDPESLTALLNDYLSAMTAIIHDEQGTVDKYEGDAIIAFWNAPLDVPDHADRVVRAALRCQARLAEMRPALKARCGHDLHMRIGINTGPAVVGNMGSHERFDYTMLGDAVNLAARLEGANKQFGTYTMLSHHTREGLGEGFALRELGRLAVVGRKAPVTVYEPLPAEFAPARRDALEIFARGLALFYGGELAAAGAAFAACAAHDPAAAAYADKCRSLAGQSLEGWQGVWVMTQK